MTERIKTLLEPGVLLSGALIRELLQGPISGDLPAGTRLGAFRVVREIGRGGMGVVHLAERDDGEFTQQVALKCLADPASVAGSQLFRRERQILAGLQHPHIARLLDGGRSDDGLLWFAMEWIDGERIDRHCARQALSLDDRLRLWIGVAAAVQFAHARLLIHRDIKPGNVLVDGDGEPRLLDFGIASLLGDGDTPRAFSPDHASPEQRDGGDVGTASDQYQLGRLLATLLTATVVHDTAATTRAADDSSPALSAAAAPLAVTTTARDWIAMPSVRRRELTAVIERACATDPSARYGSVAELKTEVQRVLERRPVDVQRGRWLYVFGCSLRRRPAMAATIALASITVIAMVSVFNLKLAQERDLATAETAKVKAINAFVSDDLLASANPFDANQSDLSMREALDRARQRLAARFVDQPAIEAELRQTLGATYAGIGDLASAKAELAKALQLRLGFEQPTSVGVVAIRLLQSQRALTASEYSDADAKLRALIGELERVRSEADGQLLAARIQRVQALGFLGHLEDARTLDASLAEPAGALDPLHTLALDRADASGHLQLLMGHADQALAIFDASAQRCMQAFGGSDPRSLRSLEGKARALRDLGRHGDAVPVLRGLFEQRLAIFGREHPETLRNHNELAVALSRNGDRAAAIAIWTEDLAIKQQRLGADHASTLSTRYNLGNELIASQRFADAERTFRELLAAERAARGDSDPGALITQMSLANAINRQSRPVEALVLLDQALEAGRDTFSERPELGILLGYRSRSLAALGRTKEARSDAEAAIDVFEATVGATHRRTLQAREWLASLAAR